MPDTFGNDESLMQAVSRGDLGAFEQLVRRHQAWVWKIAYRFLNDKEEAEDITQEAFLRLLDASGRYQATAKFTTYLYQIVCRQCLDRARKKQPVYMAEIPEILESNPGASETMKQAEVSAKIDAALRSLPPDYRMAIILKYFEGLSGADIARAMKKSPKGVERILARARKKLEPLLRGFYEIYSQPRDQTVHEENHEIFWPSSELD